MPARWWGSPALRAFAGCPAPVRIRPRRQPRSRISKASASNSSGRGVAVVTICPGFIATPLTAAQSLPDAVSACAGQSCATHRARHCPAPALLRAAVADGVARACAALRAAAAIRSRRRGPQTQAPAFRLRRSIARQRRLGWRRARDRGGAGAHREPRAEPHRAVVRTGSRRDCVVARTGFCVHPREARRVPKIGGTKDPDLARLRELRPTHLIVNVDENRRDVVDAARAFVPHVVVTHPNDPSENLRLYALFGSIFGREREAAALADDLTAAIAEADAAARRLPREQVLYVIWRKPWMTVARRDVHRRDAGPRGMGHAAGARGNALSGTGRRRARRGTTRSASCCRRSRSPSRAAMRRRSRSAGASRSNSSTANGRPGTARVPSRVCGR